jgi:hypothetical protein
VREQRRRAFHVVVERARTEAAGQEAFTSIAATAARFLDAKLELAAVLAPRTGAPDAAGAEPRTQAIARIAATLLAPGAAAPRRAVND